ncbi:hypothetical protein [Actinoplanes sp. NPDC049265]|uniref:hypothetical protein n=1 Tax=Actinoplanes sp. NPDC049265 TaxID=3363902 RepID=UPI0037135E5B
MNRLLAIPVIVGAFVLSTACSGIQPSAGSPAPQAPAASTPVDSAPADADQPAVQPEKAKDVRKTKTAAQAKNDKSTKTTKTTSKREGGDATFPISPGTHLVLLHSYNSAKHTAVIEPATFSKDGSAVNGDGSRYTLPVNSSPKIFSTNGGNPDCMDGEGFKTTGSCMAGADWLKKQLGHGGFPVTIANTGDFIYEIAEQYRP